jgi:cytochrome d ubiquinol oxidase subunit I
MGRQPWVVYGLLRTSDALSRVVTANQIVFSLILFTIVYIVLFILFLFLLNRKILHGPVDYGTPEEIEDGNRRDNPLLEHTPI